LPLALLLAFSGTEGIAGAHSVAAGSTPDGSPAASGSAAGGEYGDLVRARSGPCEGSYRIQDGIPGVGCTHGPDAVPSVLAAPWQQAPPVGGAVTSAVKCIGDGTAGPRIEAIYAHAANRPDLYALALPFISVGLAQATAQVEESAARTGGYRSLRFVTSACEPVVRNVTLSAQGDDTIGATATELYNMGFNHPERDYLVFVDSEVYCGIAYLGGRYARVDKTCWNYAELHELTHNFGAVQPSAPNSSGGGHCTDESDIMCYSDEPYFPLMRQVCDFVFEHLLDCNADDYFSTAPQAGSFLSYHPEFNTADTPFMADVDGEPPVLLPPTPLSYTGPQYTVRAYNADDDLCVYGEGPAIQRRVRFFCVGYKGDRTADVTGALLQVAGSATAATLRLVGNERGNGTAVGFTVYKDGTPILDEKAGLAGYASSGLPLLGIDPITGQSTFYDRAIAVDLTQAQRRRIGGPRSSQCKRAKSKAHGKQQAAQRLTRRLVRMHRSLRRQYARLLAGPASARDARVYRRRLRTYNRKLKELKALRRQSARSKRAERDACRA
jgi:hypothetical protein